LSLSVRVEGPDGNRSGEEPMTAREFIKAIANGEADIVQILLDLLVETRSGYCVVGGLAVNAYVEPVVSLDMDIVVVAEQVERICEKAVEKGLQVERFPHSINLHSNRSELRVQLQTDARYQAFISRASEKRVLGYDMQVAHVEDVLQGKLWAYQDETRRKSKRQKDLADIARIIEAYPTLVSLLPDPVRRLVD